MSWDWAWRLPDSGVLPEFNAKDSALGTDVPIAGITGHDGDYVQATVSINAPMSFSQKGSALGVGQISGVVATKRRSNLLVMVIASANVPVGFRISLTDNNNVVAWTSEKTVSQSGEQIESAYVAELGIYQVIGAAKAGIKITTLSSGTCDVFLAAV